MDNELNNKWHLGFYGALELELDDDRDLLEFQREKQLSKEPLRLDMLVVKKTGNQKLKNELGHIFEKYNVFEYKSPSDGLSIDDFYKTVAYACLIKSNSDKINDIKADEITISLVRQHFPRELINRLRNENFVINKYAPGIYYVSGNIFKTQIIVTDKLECEHTWLRVIAKHAKENDVINFIYKSKNYEKKYQKENVDVVYQISVYANKGMYEDIKRRNDGMWCKELRELMKPELDEAVAEGRAEGRAETIKKMSSKGMSYVEIVDLLDLDMEYVKSIVGTK